MSQAQNTIEVENDADLKDVYEQRSSAFGPESYELEDPDANPADLDQYYSNLENYVRMVAGDYSNLLTLDAPGGLGKTYNVRRVLKDVLDDDQWTHQKGFTTPLELYKTLYECQENDHVLFLDDVTGISNNSKALDMLKAATDTEGDENIVQYRSSKDIENPNPNESRPLPNAFVFRGAIIMSFNSTPDNADFDALKDRGTDYEMNFDYHERLDLIKELAKKPDFSELPVHVQQETAEWVATVSDPSVEVSIRTFENICKMRQFGHEQGRDWEKMALDVFDLDYERYMIVRLMDRDIDVMDQIEIFEERTGRSQTHYYNLKNRIIAQRMD